MPTKEQPIRVAVIGGGCASLTTAFELTRPELGGKFAVTVYQMGWRLGGKGASGRGVHDRIEEHGLHLWMGFYENAFRLMRECYAELGAADPHRRFTDWRQAFSPANDVAVVDPISNTEWDAWVAHFPATPGLPGDPIEDRTLFSVANYLRQATTLVAELIRSANAATPPDPPTPRTADSPASLFARAADLLGRYGQLATWAALYEACDILRASADVWIPGEFRDAMFSEPYLRLIDALAAGMRRQLETIVDRDAGLRRVWHVVDVILATLRGSTVHALALDPRGFDAINEYDWREWLRMHGASEQSLDSGFMRGIYDLAFAFEEGDVSRPRLGAGVALRGAMRMFFTYRGALFWRMNAGMGDIVFAPLYEVLKRRGVRFAFFHRLRNITLAPAVPGETPYAEALELDVQARIKGGEEYQPLVDVRGLPSWPAKPDYDQLVNGATLRREGRAFEAPWEDRRAAQKTLRVGRDFDFVVLGVSIGAVPHVARELCEREPRWAAMVSNVKTVSTQCLQLWLTKSTAELGWPHGPVNLSGFVEPFDTWADMTHLVPEEHWDGVRSIAYFCSVLPDRAYDARVTEESYRAERAHVRANAIRFLECDLPALWPGIRDATGGFRWDVLATSGRGVKRRVGSEAIDHHFWGANVHPSDRYVLSLPGSMTYRLSPLDRSFDNLTIAGDWTASGLDSGCIESAVMSGRLAAHALSQLPPLEDIVGYNHP
jgi:uncharacterized protein with NAD-binding domain and iron-sulfur cluster